jgi:hypothetical protein
MRATALPSLVQQVLTHEAEQARNEQDQQKAQGQQGLPEDVSRACDKLRVHLSTRIGPDGFRILLLRALTLAKSQFPHLSAVRVAPSGTLEGLEGASEQAEIAEGAAAAAILILLLELLVTFIGGDLTGRMLSTLWPMTALLEDREDFEENEGMNTESGTEQGKKSETAEIFGSHGSIGREVDRG